MLELIRQPWPWYVAGPLIGAMVPLLLIMGNKPFGISSSMRHVCAAFFPAKISYFQYNWKKEMWNLFFIGGLLIGGLVAAQFLADPNPVVVDPRLLEEISRYGITNISGQVPEDIISWASLGTLRGVVMMVGGGFLVGFGTRYAGGCTSGHSIMGLSNLQLPSLIATCCFMAGGFIMANLILPYILSL